MIGDNYYFQEKKGFDIENLFVEAVVVVVLFVIYGLGNGKL